MPLLVSKRLAFCEGIPVALGQRLLGEGIPVANTSDVAVEGLRFHIQRSGLSVYEMGQRRSMVCRSVSYQYPRAQLATCVQLDDKMGRQRRRVALFTYLSLTDPALLQTRLQDCH